MSLITDHVIILKQQQDQLPGSASLCDNICDHGGNHGSTGRDPINVDGLSGLLADNQKAGYIGSSAINLTGLSNGYLLKYEVSSNTWVVSPGSGGIEGLQLNYEHTPTISTKTAAGALVFTADETTIDFNVTANDLRITNGANRLLFSVTPYSATPAIIGSGIVIRGVTSLDLYAPNGPLFQCNNVVGGIPATDGTASAFDTVKQSILEAINENVGDISTNASAILINVADIADHESRITQNETDIAALQDLRADDILLQELTGSTEAPVQDMINHIPGRGQISYSGTVDNGDGTITAPSGLFFGSRSSTPGSQKGYFTIPAGVGLSLTLGASNYLVADFVTGAYSLVVDPTNYLNREDRIVVDIIHYEVDGTRHVLEADPGYLNIHTLLTQRAFDMAEGKGYLFAERAKGAIIGTTGTRNVTLNAGTFWAAYRRKVSPAFNTSTGSTMTRYYRNGSGGYTKQTGQTQLDNLYYDNGTGTLALMNTGRFKCVNMYLTFDADTLIEVEGQNQYTSLALAEAEGRPTAVPAVVSQFAVYLGRYIVQQGSNTVVTESAFTSEIGLGPVTSHSELSGLNADLFYQHYSSTPDIGAIGIEINQTKITGNTDKFQVKNLDLSLLWSRTINSRAYRRLAVNDRYIAVVDSSTGLHIFDRRSGIEIYTFATNGLNAPIVFIDESHLALASTASIRVINIHDESYTDHTITGMGTVDSIAYRNGSIYIIDNDNDLWTIDTLAWTYGSVAVSGLSSEIVSIDVDRTATYAYVLDTNATAGASVYARKITISTGGIVASTLLGTSTVGGGANQIFCDPAGVYVMLGLTSQTAHKFLLLNTSLTVTFTGTATPASYQSGMLDGIIYSTASGTTLYAYQIAALTTEISDFSIRGGEGLNWSNSVVNDDGTPWKYTEADKARAVRDHAEHNPRMPYFRVVTATDDILPIDKGNVIVVSDTRSAQVDLTPTAAVLAENGFEFSVLVEYNATYGATVDADGSYYWNLADADDPSNVVYEFIVYDGKVARKAIPTQAGGPA